MTDTIANSSDDSRSYLDYPKDNLLRPIWRGVLNAVGRKPLQLRNSKPIVSIAFDDFPRTALTTGAAILEEAGARGTFYTALGLAGTNNLLGPHFQLEELGEVVARGHELASHTFDHVSAREISNRGFLLNVEKGYASLGSIPGLAPTANFAYPFGCTNLRLKFKVGKIMQSCRGNFPGINGTITDRSLLRANPLYGGSDALKAAVQLVESNCRTNGWLIFYTHDVRPTPSKFGCSPALLAELVDSVCKLGCCIMTVAEVINKAGQID